MQRSREPAMEVSVTDSCLEKWPLSPFLMINQRSVLRFTARLQSDIFPPPVFVSNVASNCISRQGATKDVRTRNSQPMAHIHRHEGPFLLNVMDPVLMTVCNEARLCYCELVDWKAYHNRYLDCRWTDLSKRDLCVPFPDHLVSNFGDVDDKLKLQI